MTETETPKHKHEQLGLTFAEYGALLAVRQLLVTGDIKFDVCSYPADNQHYFNMNVPLNVGDDPGTECGTVGCIGGYMALILGLKGGAIEEFVDAREADTEYFRARRIRALFYPPSDDRFSWDDLTPEMAVEAIDNFIKTGNPNWYGVAEQFGILKDYDDSYDEDDED